MLSGDAEQRSCHELSLVGEPCAEFLRCSRAGLGHCLRLCLATRPTGLAWDHWQLRAQQDRKDDVPARRAAGLAFIVRSSAFV